MKRIGWILIGVGGLCAAALGILVIIRAYQLDEGQVEPGIPPIEVAVFWVMVTLILSGLTMLINAALRSRRGHRA